MQEDIIRSYDKNKRIELTEKQLLYGIRSFLVVCTSTNKMITHIPKDFLNFLIPTNEGINSSIP